MSWLRARDVKPQSPKYLGPDDSDVDVEGHLMAQQAAHRRKSGGGSGAAAAAASGTSSIPPHVKQSILAVVTVSLLVIVLFVQLQMLSLHRGQQVYSARQMAGMNSRLSSLAHMQALGAIAAWTGVELMATNSQEWAHERHPAVWPPTAAQHLRDVTCGLGAAAQTPESLAQCANMTAVGKTLERLPSSCDKPGNNVEVFHEPPPLCWTEALHSAWLSRSDATRAMLAARDAVLEHARQKREDECASLAAASSSVPAPECTLPPVPRPALGIREIQMISITGQAHHLDRAIPQMATFLSRFPSGNVVLATDVLGTPEGAHMTAPPMPLVPVSPDGKLMGYWDSQQKWLYAWERAFAVSNLDGTHQWFMTTDDDTYASPANLVEFVSTLDPLQPVIIGEITTFPIVRPQGGAGWLISLGAARLIRPILNECKGYRPPAHHGPLVENCTSSDVFIPACWADKLPKGALTWIRAHEFNQQNIPWNLKFDAEMPPSEVTLQGRFHSFSRAVTFHRLQEWQEMLGVHQVERAYEAEGRPQFRAQLAAQIDWLTQAVIDARRELTPVQPATPPPIE